ncbi:MAG: divalent-cation tolerance protein CutA [Ghiorsea sp.]|nr:divalent-cation tolerance protein CutA [Ghiorsea sp.]
MNIILTSIDDYAKAKNMAKDLVELKLAACVQISAQGESIYQWQGKLCQDMEYYLSIKTTSTLKAKVFTWLETNHPYDTPEIITFNAKTSEKYDAWLNRSTTSKKASP